MTDVTQILQQIDQGDSNARTELYPAVYEELRRLAAAKLSHERADHTLSSTALVHEVYLRLVGFDAERRWDSRAQFFSAAAEAMRRILVDHARQRLALKRGGSMKRASGLGDLAGLTADPATLIDLHEAIDRLAETDEQAAEMLKILVFAGLSVAEAGRSMGLSRKVAYRHWDYIRSWFAVHYGTDER
ncbi:ECF sigma factor [Pirellulimonas nuda]|uniref:ECF sigma factor n=1 Tax=Pirellulimonas nuda TaxID=2528009 RepID=A0A518DC95_9BACT|nr:ECF-type sigma factor [Pirellulimonas nuda]QDU89111.1 ECF sigma factor [Pirellulimonas nuda]